MASGLTLKELYEKYYDAKIGLSTYFVPDSDFSQEAVIGRGEFLSRVFKSDLKGDTLIKYGGALLPSSILPACESFNKIIIIDFLDSNLEVMNQWLNKEPGTIVPCELENHRLYISPENTKREEIDFFLEVSSTKT
ncbi:nicotinamide N-methyltransferase-like isoform X2 [Lissotriton helveticus]